MQYTWKMEARYRMRDTWIWDRLMGIRDRRLERNWAKRGRFGPPHMVKQRILRDYAMKYGATTLVETGTYLGDMVYAMRDSFKNIYSIELNRELYERAQQSFKKYPHIHFVLGNSATELDRVLYGIEDRCVFWLDGHYSGGITSMADERCPLRGELRAIIRHPVKGHVLLIDDAVCFDGKDGYPTLFELHDFVAMQLPGYEVKIFDNIIQIAPSAATK